MRRFITRMLAVIGLSSLLLVGATSPSVRAADPLSGVCSDSKAAKTSVCQDGSDENSIFTILRNVINTLLFVGGIIAVVMIIVGGIRYVVSAGDSQSANTAKDTILYAVVGLVVAIMSYAIVNFVLNRI